mmetsp:Transcript_47216/g.75647  ORF Transcript_47216/g.75647 Transcript_47216/m.75647 type:complete len:302 (-) Transcript_47216:2619-3524(-)
MGIRYHIAVPRRRKYVHSVFPGFVFCLLLLRVLRHWRLRITVTVHFAVLWLAAIDHDAYSRLMRSTSVCFHILCVLVLSMKLFFVFALLQFPKVLAFFVQLPLETTPSKLTLIVSDRRVELDRVCVIQQLFVLQPALNVTNGGLCQSVVLELCVIIIVAVILVVVVSVRVIEHLVKFVRLKGHRCFDVFGDNPKINLKRRQSVLLRDDIVYKLDGGRHVFKVSRQRVVDSQQRLELDFGADSFVEGLQCALQVLCVAILVELLEFPEVAVLQSKLRLFEVHIVFVHVVIDTHSRICVCDVL